MGMYMRTTLFVASPDAVREAIEGVGEHADTRSWALAERFHSADLESVDTIKATSLNLILQGRDPGDEAYQPHDIDQLLAANDELGSLTLHGNSGLVRLPAALLGALATLETSRVLDVARRWAATDEWRWERVDAKRLEPVVRALRTLARKARDGESLYLWWSL